MKLGGMCGVCGASNNDGGFWHTTAKVIDHGIEGVPPIEPDMSEPERCEECERAVFQLKVRQSLGDMRRTEEMLRRKLGEAGGDQCE